MARLCYLWFRSEPPRDTLGADSIDARADPTGVDARATVDGIGHQVDTCSEAIGETERRACQVVVWRLDETRAGAGEAGVIATVEGAGAAVSRIGGEIDAEGAAYAQPGRAGFPTPDANAPLARLIQTTTARATRPTVDHAGHHVDAEAATVGRAGGTLRHHTDAVFAVLVDSALVLAGAAVVDVLSEIAAAIGRTAVREASRAIRAITDAGTALDSDEPAFADGAASATVAHVGREIDAVSCAVSQAGRTLGSTRSLALTDHAALTYGASDAACPAVARVVIEIGAVALDPLWRSRRLAAIDPAQGTGALPTSADEATHVRAEGAAGAAMLAIDGEIDAVSSTARQTGGTAIVPAPISSGATRATTTLALRHGVPVAEVTRFRPGGLAIDRAPALGYRPLTDADRDQRGPLTSRDAHLEGAADRLADDGQALPTWQEQGAVLQIATVGERKAQLTFHLVIAHALSQRTLGGRPETHRCDKGECAGPPLSASRGLGASEAEGAQQAAGRGRAERGAARPRHRKAPGQSIEVIGVHVASTAATHDNVLASPVTYSGVSSSGLTRGKQVSGVAYVQSSSEFPSSGTISEPASLRIGWSAVSGSVP